MFEVEEALQQQVAQWVGVALTVLPQIAPNHPFRHFDEIVLNAQDYLGRVPMFIALMSDHMEIAWQLARAGTDATVRTQQGASLLILAVRREDAEMARWLLEKGANVNAIRQDHPQATALMVAAATHSMRTPRRGSATNLRPDAPPVS